MTNLKPQLHGRSRMMRTGSRTTTVLRPLFALSVMVLLVGEAMVCAEPAESFQSFTEDGGWCWFADPRAVARAGKTYTGWVTENGSVQAAMLDDASGKITITTLHEKYQRDDHDNPSFLFLPDGRLMAFYSKHGGPDMNARVTTRPGDFTDWQPERVLDLFGTAERPRKTITYPNPVMLSAETNAIYLFWRGDSWKPTFSKSMDAGLSWSPAKVVVARSGAGNDNRPYVKIASDGQERIHIIFTDGHPRNESSNSVYYACYRNGAFYKANGTRIADEAQLPFTPDQADCVYNAAVTGARAWVFDVASDEAGRPVIAYTRLAKETDHRYHYARWNGVEWTDRELCAGGKWFPQSKPGKSETETYYSGGLALDHDNPSVVYLSRPVGYSPLRVGGKPEELSHGASPVNGVREIERWATADAGKTWKSEAVTSGSKHDNIRPVVVRGHSGSGPTVLWESLSGHYVHYTDYRASIRMDRSHSPQRTSRSTKGSNDP